MRNSSRKYCIFGIIVIITFTSFLVPGLGQSVFICHSGFVSQIEMDNYFIWAVIGGIVAIVLVSLCYMGFFSYARGGSSYVEK